MVKFAIAEVKSEDTSPAWDPVKGEIRCPSHVNHVAVWPRPRIHSPYPFLLICYFVVNLILN
jgi:hypothetical protein